MSTFDTCQTSKFVARERLARQLLACELQLNPRTLSNLAEPTLTAHDAGRSAVARDVPSALRLHAFLTNQRSQSLRANALC